ncbi:glycoside hydrolase family 16 protein [Trematosphaeria pertusa]|uniref:chitinase n=1 Tax=Trematosphaeria pertusa TaxID=390896 RepID=A0A6A6ILH0_9PLEO|nr:glycoside hydrolase family 16 protein [Trematosphaeria pertusa]KAF2251444.1 glycoside hydrolase family 16 protein [Trematosphaeria pertusa]
MRFITSLTASAFVALATAQTFTDCDPTKKTCPNNPAMPADFSTDFKAGASGVKGWKQTAGTLNYGASGAEFTVAKKGDAPTIQSEGYLHFGYIEVKMKAAPGQGIISSIVLQSDDLDEVDWEFIGGVSSKVQMNYFGKGNTTTYDRMVEADVSNVQEMHTYALNWTADALTWIIDNAPVRTLKFADANGGNNYPQTPSNVRIGIWAGGDSENEGTRSWAGGPVDYSKAPFTQTVESVKIINYTPAKEYQWTDQSGSYKSIKAIGAGDTEGAPQNSAVIQPSATGEDAGLGTGVNAPTATGVAGTPAESTPCSDGEQMPSSTPVPVPSGGPYTNGTTPPGETPCDCGTLTVTVTGTPPATPEVPPASSAPAPPPVESSASPPGIVTDTRPAPSVPVPSAPTGALPTPSGNATTTAPPLFPGAASSHKAGALVGLVGAAMVLLV